MIVFSIKHKIKHRFSCCEIVITFYHQNHYKKRNKNKHRTKTGTTFFVTRLFIFVVSIVMVLSVQFHCLTSELHTVDNKYSKRSNYAWIDARVIDLVFWSNVIKQKKILNLKEKVIKCTWNEVRRNIICVTTHSFIYGHRESISRKLESKN